MLRKYNDGKRQFIGQLTMDVLTCSRQFRKPITIMLKTHDLNTNKMANLLDRFRHDFVHDEFQLFPRQSINDVVAHKNVSTGYGVYIISGCCETEQNIIYIGKSGTIRQDGKTKTQGIRKRLTMKQSGSYRRMFFQNVISELNLDCLHIEWFVTWSSNARTPPFLAEAELLAAYLTTYDRLPVFNMSA
jgi:hypothetical protein